MVRDLEMTRSYPIAGTLRIGEKKENRPTSLNYFTVHEDTHTTDDVTQNFNFIFGEKPREVIIRFLSDDPFETDYLRYAKSGLQCKGNGETANYLDKTKKEWCECKCSKDCKYRGNECKLTGRLLFVIKNVDIGGLWVFQTRGYNSITNILRTLNFLKCMNVDIKEKDFKLIIKEETSNEGGEIKKYTSVELKVIVSKEELMKKKSDNNPEVKEETQEIIPEQEEPKTKKKSETKKNKTEDSVTTEEKEEKEQNESNQESTINTNADDFEKCLSLIEVHDLTIKDKVYKEAAFCNMNDQTEKLIIHSSILDEVLTWEIGSAIIPTKILEKNGFRTLTEYKDLGIMKKKKAE